MNLPYRLNAQRSLGKEDSTGALEFSTTWHVSNSSTSTFTSESERQQEAAGHPMTVSVRAPLRSPSNIDNCLGTSNHIHGGESRLVAFWESTDRIHPADGSAGIPSSASFMLTLLSEGHCSFPLTFVVRSHNLPA